MNNNCGRQQVARFEVLGKSYSVFEGMNVIGRDTDCSILIKNLKLSKKHAIISIIGNNHYITDFNSSNGTKLDDKRLNPYIYSSICDLSNITLGDVSGTYYIHSENCEVSSTQKDGNSQICEYINTAATQKLEDQSQNFNQNTNVTVQLSENAKVKNSSMVLCEDTLNLNDSMDQSFANIIVDESLNTSMQNISDVIPCTQDCDNYVTQNLKCYETKMNTIKKVDTISKQENSDTDIEAELINTKKNINKPTEEKRLDNFKTSVPEYIKNKSGENTKQNTTDDDINYLGPTQKLTPTKDATDSDIFLAPTQILESQAQDSKNNATIAETNINTSGDIDFLGPTQKLTPTKDSKNKDSDISLAPTQILESQDSKNNQTTEEKNIYLADTQDLDSSEYNSQNFKMKFDLNTQNGSLSEISEQKQVKTNEQKTDDSGDETTDELDLELQQINNSDKKKQNQSITNEQKIDDSGDETADELDLLELQQNDGKLSRNSTKSSEDATINNSNQKTIIHVPRRANEVNTDSEDEIDFTTSANEDNFTVSKPKTKPPKDNFDNLNIEDDDTTDGLDFMALETNYTNKNVPTKITDNLKIDDGSNDIDFLAVNGNDKIKKPNKELSIDDDTDDELEFSVPKEEDISSNVALNIKTSKNDGNLNIDINDDKITKPNEELSIDTDDELEFSVPKEEDISSNVAQNTKTNKNDENLDIDDNVSDDIDFLAATEVLENSSSKISSVLNSLQNSNDPNDIDILEAVEKLETVESDHIKMGNKQTTNVINIVKRDSDDEDYLAATQPLSKITNVLDENKINLQDEHEPIDEIDDDFAPTQLLSGKTITDSKVNDSFQEKSKIKKTLEEFTTTSSVKTNFISNKNLNSSVSSKENTKIHLEKHIEENEDFAAPTQMLSGITVKTIEETSLPEQLNNQTPDETNDFVAPTGKTVKTIENKSLSKQLSNLIPDEIIDIDFTEPTLILSGKTAKTIEEKSLSKQLNNQVPDETNDIDFSAPTQMLSGKTAKTIEEKSLPKQLNKQIPDETNDIDFTGPRQMLSGKTLKTIEEKSLSKQLNNQMLDETNDIDFTEPTQILSGKTVKTIEEKSLSRQLNKQIPDETNDIDFSAPTQMLSGKTAKTIEEKSLSKQLNNEISDETNDFTEPTQMLSGKSKLGLNKKSDGFLIPALPKIAIKSIEILNLQDHLTADIDDSNFLKSTQELLRNVQSKSTDTVVFSDATQKLSSEMNEKDDNGFLVSTQQLMDDSVTNNDFILSQENDSIPEVPAEIFDNFAVPSSKNTTVIDKINHNAEIFLNPTQILNSKPEIIASGSKNIGNEDEEIFLAPTQELLSKQNTKNIDNEKIDDDNSFLAPTQEIMDNSVEKNIEKAQNNIQDDSLLLISDDDSEGSDIIIRKKKVRVLETQTQNYESDAESEIGYKRKRVSRIIETQEVSENNIVSSIPINDFSLTEDNSDIIPSTQLDESMRLVLEESLESKKSQNKPIEVDTQFELDLPTEREYFPPPEDRPDNPLLHILSGEQTQKIPETSTEKNNSTEKPVKKKFNFKNPDKKNSSKDNGDTKIENSKNDSLEKFVDLINHECDNMVTQKTTPDLNESIKNSEVEDYNNEYFNAPTQAIDEIVENVITIESDTDEEIDENYCNSVTQPIDELLAEKTPVKPRKSTRGKKEVVNKKLDEKKVPERKSVRETEANSDRPKRNTRKSVNVPRANIKKNENKDVSNINFDLTVESLQNAMPQTSTPKPSTSRRATTIGIINLDIGNSNKTENTIPIASGSNEGISRKRITRTNPVEENTETKNRNITKDSNTDESTSFQLPKRSRRGQIDEENMSKMIESKHVNETIPEKDTKKTRRATLKREISAKDINPEEGTSKKNTRKGTHIGESSVKEKIADESTSGDNTETKIRNITTESSTDDGASFQLPKRSKRGQIEEKSVKEKTSDESTSAENSETKIKNISKDSSTDESASFQLPKRSKRGQIEEENISKTFNAKHVNETTSEEDTKKTRRATLKREISAKDINPQEGTSKKNTRRGSHIEENSVKTSDESTSAENSETKIRNITKDSSTDESGSFQLPKRSRRGQIEEENISKTINAKLVNEIPKEDTKRRTRRGATAEREISAKETNPKEGTSTRSKNTNKGTTTEENVSHETTEEDTKRRTRRGATADREIAAKETNSDEGTSTKSRNTRKSTITEEHISHETIEEDTMRRTRRGATSDREIAGKETNPDEGTSTRRRTARKPTITEENVNDEPPPEEDTKRRTRRSATAEREIAANETNPEEGKSTRKRTARKDTITEENVSDKPPPEEDTKKRTRTSATEKIKVQGRTLKSTKEQEEQSADESISESVKSRKRSIRKNTEDTEEHEEISKPAKEQKVTRTKLKFKIVFTMLEDGNLEAVVSRLGGVIVNSSHECNVLVTSKISRSLKFMVAVALGKPIVSTDWVKASGRAHRFLDPWDYILSDPESEHTFDFKLKDAIITAGKEKIMQEYTFLILVNKNNDVLKDVIASCGGKVVSRYNNSINNLLVVSYEEDKSKYSRYLKMKPPVKVIAAEAIFASVLRQKFEIDVHLLN